MATTLGIISDTHGLMRPEALEALSGVALILHAGDVGAPEIMEALVAIAPVHAVRGNIDTEHWAQELPLSLEIAVEQCRILLIHNRNDVRFVPGGVTVVISGHSHRSKEELRDGILFLNPGSAGPRRFKLPITLMRAVVDGTAIHPELVQLQV